MHARSGTHIALSVGSPNNYYIDGYIERSGTRSHSLVPRFWSYACKLSERFGHAWREREVWVKATRYVE